MAFRDEVAISRNGRRISLTLGGSGEPVVLLHGYPLHRQMWNQVLSTLSEHYLVIAPDMQGFGESELGPSFESMHDLAKGIHELLDDLQILQSISLVGLSMGGYVALEFYARYANRVKNLVLMDTRAASDNPSGAANRLEIAHRVLIEGTQAVTEGMLSKMLAPATLIQNPTLVEQLRQMMFSTSPDTIASAQRAMATRRDFTAMLAQFTVPTLLVVGEHDAISPVDEMRQMSQEIPGSEFVVIRNSGHLPPMESPLESSTALLDFLERH